MRSFKNGLLSGLKLCCPSTKDECEGVEFVIKTHIRIPAKHSNCAESEGKKYSYIGGTKCTYTCVSGLSSRSWKKFLEFVEVQSPPCSPCPANWRHGLNWILALEESEMCPKELTGGFKFNLLLTYTYCQLDVQN